MPRTTTTIITHCHCYNTTTEHRHSYHTHARTYVRYIALFVSCCLGVAACYRATCRVLIPRPIHPPIHNLHVWSDNSRTKCDRIGVAWSADGVTWQDSALLAVQTGGNHPCGQIRTPLG